MIQVVVAKDLLEHSLSQLRVTLTRSMEPQSSRTSLRLEVPNFEDGGNFSPTKKDRRRLAMEFEDVSPVSPSRYQDRLILPLG